MVTVTVDIGRNPLTIHFLVMETKVLIFPNPIAACVAYGLMSGLALATIPTESKYCLVYATKLVFNPSIPIEWWTIAYNEILFGTISDKIAYAENAVVGFIEVSPSTASPHNSTCYEGMAVCQFSKCHAFDRPVKTPLDALTDNVINHLIENEPSHSFHGHLLPMELSGTLHLPLNEEAFFSLDTLREIDIELTKPVAKVLLDDDGELVPFELLHATCHGMVKYFAVNGTIVTELTDEYEPILYYSTLQTCGKDIRRKLHLEISPIKRLR